MADKNNFDRSNSGKHSIEKNSIEKNGRAETVCPCTRTTGLFIRNRELSYCIALCLIGLFFVFMAGFFWGQQHAIEDFLRTLHRDSLSDHVSFSLYSLGDKKLEEEGSREEGLTEDDEEEESSVSDTSDISEHSENNENNENSENSENSRHATGIIAENTGCGTPYDLSRVDERYYAQLIGFGTLSAAEQFANHVTKKGFSVKVEKRRSTSAKGRTMWWYQVVTDTDTDKERLKKSVDILVKQEKLRNVRIVKRS